ncbi:MAG: hypothetical protein OHK0052_03280 [Anaerolineales bacterium]
MQQFQYIPKTELARNTRQVIQNVLRGKTAVIENHGQPEVAIMDIVDYYLQQAFIRYHANLPDAPAISTATERSISGIVEQSNYDNAMRLYLSEQINLSRLAELLNLPVLDLRLRFVRLSIPLRLGNATNSM